MKLQLNKRNRKGFTLIELMVVIAILAALAAVGYGPIMDHMGDGDRQAASSNMGNIHTSLLSFRQDNNSFPCDATAANLKRKKPDYNFGNLTGDSSNCYLRQLFYGDLKDEKLFYAKISGFHEGDNDIANGKALEPGENAFSYVVKPNKETGAHDPIPSQESTTPILLSCVAPSDNPYTGDAVLFDMNAFRCHAYMVTVDGRVTDLRDKPGFEDEDEDTTKTDTPIFPKSKKGVDQSAKYSVLTPEMAL